MESDCSLPPTEGLGPSRSIFFHPDQPYHNHWLEYMRQHAGWDLASSPETADWCVLYNKGATWVLLPEGDPFAEIASTWINGRCRDISKRTVERVFAEVFGYPLAIDPLTHQGRCLRKSNKNFVKVNGVKDVGVLECPIPLSELDDQYVYERLVDSRVPGLGLIELRTTVIRGTVVSVSRKIKQDWISTGCYVGKNLDMAIVYPSSVFSDQELEQIRVFCEAMGLDFGTLDIIRDNEDQRIYILDANKTPSGWKNWPQLTQFSVEQFTRAFIERYPPRSARPAFSRSAVPLHSTTASPDEVRSIGERLDAQTERITQLTVEVSVLGARIAQVLAADSVVPQRSGKKKRKK